MGKTLFDVLLPATGNRYDLWVPDDMCMGQVSMLVAEAIQLVEPDFYARTPDSVLMYQVTGEVQDPMKTVAEIGFTDGDRFVLL